MSTPPEKSPVTETAIEEATRQYGGDPESLQTACDAVERLLRSEYNLLDVDEAELVAVQDGQFVFSIDYTSPLFDEIAQKASRSSPTNQRVCEKTKHAHQSHATIELGIDDGVFDVSHCLVTSSPPVDQYTDVGLSETQARVYQLGEAGYSIRQIAGLMGISPGTVKSHRNRIRQKVDQARRLVDLFDAS